MKYIIISYLILINLIGFLIMGIDKRKAQKKQYRISEKALFTVAFLGGSMGTTLGMNHFRHKTKHWYFKYGMPLILVIEIGILIGLVGMFA